jgi:hypothetical protein
MLPAGTIGDKTTQGWGEGSTPDSSPFLQSSPLNRIIEAIEAEIQWPQAARALLAGDTNSAAKRRE